MGREVRAGAGAIGGNSALENNLIVGCTDYAIKIGSGSTAAAWNPFDNAFGPNGGGGNPIIPVRNNLAWNCGTNPMQGDDWYSSAFPSLPDSNYGAFSNGKREIVVNGEVVGEEYLGFVSAELYKDSDGDGFPDIVEVEVLGTDPEDVNDPPIGTVVDADGDGLPASIDPDDSNVDTDGDGWSDFVEWAYGTDPDDDEKFPSPFVDEGVSSPDFRLMPSAYNRAIGHGSPYRIDVLPGMESSANPKIMRRSIGAMILDDELLEDPKTGEPFYRTLLP